MPHVSRRCVRAPLFVRLPNSAPGGATRKTRHFCPGGVARCFHRVGDGFGCARNGCALVRNHKGAGGACAPARLNGGGEWERAPGVSR